MLYSPIPAALTTSEAFMSRGKAGKRNRPCASVVVRRTCSRGVPRTIGSITFKRVFGPSEPGYSAYWMRTVAPATGLPARFLTTPTNGMGFESWSTTSPASARSSRGRRRILAGASASLWTTTYSRCADSPADVSSKRPSALVVPIR